MDLLNATKMQAGYTMGMQPDGRELLVVVVKGTFTFPKNGEEPQFAEEQAPLVEADEFTGEPGFSAPLYESDYPPHKPRCDVLLNGSAYAPGGKAATKVTVTLKVGSIVKTFQVVGNRFWKKNLTGISATKPQPFTEMPISYDNAFGGSDNTHENESKHKAHMLNPIGVGFHTNLINEFIDGKPLPNTEELKHPVTKPKGKYKPMAFGPIGRGWEPRYKYGGTYDQDWLDNVFPFLPSDFNETYYQSAPIDQQCDYLQGGEEVVLRNLTPNGHIRFQIPSVQMPVAFFFKKEEPHKTQGAADTLLLEPDADRFMITWRASMPLKRNVFEVTQVLTGKMPRGWWLAWESGKTYYRSLEELISEKRREIEEEME
jgi:hypothetical protein